MSIDNDPDPDFINSPEYRKMVVKNAVTNAIVRAGTTMIICYGFEAMRDPANEEIVRENYKSARNKALQKMGVLDKDFQIVPGQEMFLC